MKTSPINFVILFFFLLSTKTFCMDLERNARLYYEQCKQIDIKNAHKLKTLIQHACNTNPTREMQNIEGKLQQFQQIIRDKKEDALIAFKKNWNITDTDWNLASRITSELNIFEEENKHIDLLNCKHDQKIPPYFTFMLKKKLIDNGLNPQRFNLNVCTNACYKVRNASISWSLENSISLIHTIFPGEIKLNPKKIQNLSHAGTEGMCILLVDMAAQKRYPTSTVAAIKEDVNLINFNKQWDNILPLCSALKSEHHAQQIKKYFFETYISNSHSIDTYKQISKIYRLHKALAWLKEYAIPKIEKPIINNDTEIQTQEK